MIIRTILKFVKCKSFLKEFLNSFLWGTVSQKCQTSSDKYLQKCFFRDCQSLQRQVSLTFQHSCNETENCGLLSTCYRELIGQYLHKETPKIH